ncbi:MAG: hypothetical protein MUC36_03115 [Planctomycetes bacterium]|nr:hypothetical protein [Planctomycetota bacterium]
MHRPLLALVPFLALLAPLAAQKGLPEPRAGLSFAPPKGWVELPATGDRGATLRLFAAPRALASKGEGSHTPLLRVMVFGKGEDAGKDVVDGLPRTTPFRGLEDFARRGLGAKTVDQEVKKAAGLDGKRITGKELPGERLLFGQTMPLEDGEAALCIEVLANQADKVKKEIEAALGSIEALARVPQPRVLPPWLADAEWATKDAATRTAARRKWAEELVAAASKAPEGGYKISKSKYWTVLSSADPAFTKKATAAAEAAREWLAKKMPELCKEAPLPAVLRVFDSVDHWTAWTIVRGDSREYDSTRRELCVVNDRDNGGPAGWGPTARAVLWQIFDDVDPGVLPGLPRWFDNGLWEFLRSSTFDGKKYEFAVGDVERGRIEYYSQNKQPLPQIWDIVQESIQPSPKDGKQEDVWGYTPECSRLVRWFWLHDGQQAFGKPTQVVDYVHAIAKAYGKLGPNPIANVSTIGLTTDQQKDLNTRSYQWRDAMLVEINNTAVPLVDGTWRALNEKWLAFNKTVK